MGNNPKSVDGRPAVIGAMRRFSQEAHDLRRKINDLSSDFTHMELIMLHEGELLEVYDEIRYLMVLCR